MCKISNILSKMSYLRIPPRITVNNIYQTTDLRVQEGDFWDNDQTYYYERWISTPTVKCCGVYRYYYLFFPHPDNGYTFRISKSAWKLKLKELKNRVPIRLTGVTTH